MASSETSSGPGIPIQHLQNPTRVSYGPNGELERSEDGPVAVLVCHGMGQQVRYETISSIAACIRHEAEREGHEVTPEQVHIFKTGDQFFTRVEVGWKDPAEKQRTVHIYEAYWAPLTEDRVTYWDTIKFLFFAGWNGLKYSKPFRRSTFQRWMFGEPVTLTIGPYTFFGIFLALLVCLLQVGIIAYVSKQMVEFISHLDTAAIQHAWKAFPAWIHSLLLGDKQAWLSFVVWVLGVPITIAARYFIIQFVGDVAAYISPYKSSKFDEVRRKIQDVGYSVGKAIYGFGAAQSTVPKYKNVVIVGHSLGSVVAYDTLNALINLDAVSDPQEKRNVVARTAALITFGSPLDKTAFIFRMQPRCEEDWTREHLAASVQPLILSYDFRPESFRWINLWSRMDIISGSLEYYDQSPDHPLHIINLKDPQASTFLRAHLEYWQGDLLRRQLYTACVGIQHVSGRT